MNYERNNNGLMTEDLYNEYCEIYDYNFWKSDDLTGILNCVLQGTDKE